MELRRVLFGSVEVADREVIAGRRDHGDVGKGRVHRRAVTGEAPGHALVRAGGRVEHVAARGRVALPARRSGWNVVRGLERTVADRSGGMARAAVALLCAVG